MILYEYPLNERIRTYLRLEHLFRRLDTLVSRESALDHHYCLATLFEIMDVAARADLKTDMLKDLDRQKHVLNSYRDNPDIAQFVLDQVLSRLDGCFSTLNAVAGKAGQALTENEWLMSLRSRINIPAGTCEFDLPAYCAWQHLDSATRRQHLMQWTGSLTPFSLAIGLLLELLRQAGTPQKVMAVGGLYNRSLPQGRGYQLLRLRIDSALQLVPEISANRLIVSVRLMRHDVHARPQSTSDDAAFELALCA